MTEPKELSTALAEVRRAYRMLHAYHQRVGDLFKLFDKAMLDKKGLGFVFKESGPAFHARMRKKGGKFWHRRWSWDVLPGYALYAVYHRRDPSLLRRVIFQVIADSGYDAKGGEPQPGEFPLSADAARSEIRLGLWETAAPRFDARDSWKAVERLLNAGRSAPLSVKAGGHDYRYNYVGVDLSQIVGDSAFEKHVLEPVRDWARLPPTKEGST